MSTIPDLDNTGFAVLGQPLDLQSQEPRTLIVLGAPRGGTSAIASILRELGIFLGDNATAPVYEDLELASRLEREDEESAGAKIEDYNQRHEVWGYKRPGMAFTIDQHHKLFRNPIYLAVFRDPFAAANRNLISSHIKNPLPEKMARIQASYTHILSFFERQKPCMLACSYEKLLLNPAGYVDFLLQQAGLSVTAEQRTAAIACIEPQPAPYLQHARADRCHGAIDGVEAGLVRGWARYRSRFVRRPVELDVTLEQVKIGCCTANLPQFENCSFDEDPAETCAFEFKLPAGSHGQLSVRASHERADIDVWPVSNAAPDSAPRLWQRLLRHFR
jgi:hypothetical protein